jgi:hypothetical protein
VAVKFQLNKGKINALEFHLKKLVCHLQFVGFGGNSVQFLHVAPKLISMLRVFLATSVWLHCAAKAKRGEFLPTLYFDTNTSLVLHPI